jgi:hypothetical protein
VSSFEREPARTLLHGLPGIVETVWLGCRRKRGYYKRHENLPFMQSEEVF